LIVRLRLKSYITLAMIQPSHAPHGSVPSKACYLIQATVDEPHLAGLSPPEWLPAVDECDVSAVCGAGLLRGGVTVGRVLRCRSGVLGDQPVRAGAAEEQRGCARDRHGDGDGDGGDHRSPSRSK
jgi:hypothetical protein